MPRVRFRCLLALLAALAVITVPTAAFSLTPVHAGQDDWRRVLTAPVGGYVRQLSCPTVQQCWFTSYESTSNPNSSDRALRTTDGGITWQDFRIADFGGRVYSTAFADPSFGFAQTSKGSFRTLDGGASWVKLALPHSGQLWMVSPQEVWLTSNSPTGDKQRVSRSIDGGLTWELWVELGTFESAGGPFFPGNRAWWGLSSTTDGWKTSRRYQPGGASVKLRSTHFLTFEVGWAAGVDTASKPERPLLFHTLDAGVTWEYWDTPVAFSSMFFVDENLGWADSCGTVYRTLDGGHTWQLDFTNSVKSNGIESFCLRPVRFDEAGNGWALGNGEVYRRGRGLPPALLFPYSGAELSLTKPTPLKWDHDPDTVQYQIQVTPANNDGPGINLIIGRPDWVQGESYLLEPPTIGQGMYVLLPGMTYSWRVRSTNAKVSVTESDPSWGPWSQPGRFRTPAPTSAGLSAVSPAPGAVVSRAGVALRWEHSNTALFYWEVQVSQDRTFTTDPATATADVWWMYVHGGITTPTNSWTTPALEPGKTYYWRVRPRVQGDGRPVTWGPVWSFTSQ